MLPVMHNDDPLVPLAVEMSHIVVSEALLIVNASAVLLVCIVNDVDDTPFEPSSLYYVL